MPSKAVLLFDRSAFCHNNSNDNDSLQRVLSCLRVVCLRLLAELKNRSPEFVFGYKIFDSRNSLTQKMERHSFCDLNLESFGDLEGKLCMCYEQSLSSTRAGHSSASNSNVSLKQMAVPSVKVLNKALTEVLCDFDWSCADLCSPIRNSKYQPTGRAPVNSLVFLFSYCPVYGDCGKDYFNMDSISSVPTLHNLLMPPALKKKFVNDLNIGLVWIDTVEWCTQDTAMPMQILKSQMLFHSAIRSLNGACVSLRVLAQASMATPLNSIISNGCMLSSQSDDSGIDNESNIRCDIADPFALTLSFCFEKDLGTKGLSRKNCCISFSSGEQVNVTLLSKILHLSRIESETANTRRQCSETQKTIERCNDSIRKFLIDSLVQAKPYGVPNHLYFCTPSDENASAENLTIFDQIMKSLVVQNKYMVLRLEGDSNRVGIIHPLSALSAAVMVFDSSPVYLSDALSDPTLSKCLSLKDLSVDVMYEVDVWESNVTDEDSDVQGSALSSQDLAVHMFSQQSRGSMDIKEASSELLFESPSREYQCLESFLKKLQHHRSGEKERPSEMSSPRQTPTQNPKKRPRSSPGCSRTLKSRRSNIMNNSPKVLPCPSLRVSSLPSTLSESDCLDEERVTKNLKDLYDSCIETKKDILHTSRTILGDVVTFIKSKKHLLDKTEISEFLDKNIFLPLKSIQEKYSKENNQESTARKTRELQLQIILNFEFEAAFPSLSPSKCIKSVTALLRAFSFVVGPCELLKFLQEHIKDQYGGSLHHILAEVGDELNVPLVPEPFSPSSPSEIGSPGQLSQKSASSCSSLITGKSSSSAVSQSQVDEVSRRRTIARHSSFSGNFHSRQIMIPKELVKKEKSKAKTEIRLLRRSPRLSLRKSNEVLRHRNPPSTKSVRRNLFNVEQKTSRSPKKKVTPATEPRAKKKLFRSKSHSVRRTIVPETPSPKQGKSAVRRKLARLQQHLTARNAVQEIAESPVTSKNDVLRSRLNGIILNNKM